MRNVIKAECLSKRLSDNHVKLLRACLDLPFKDERGTFAGKWLKDHCERQGIRFHQGWLTTLSNEGLLAKDDLTRGGTRRYYRIADEILAREILEAIGTTP